MTFFPLWIVYESFGERKGKQMKNKEKINLNSIRVNMQREETEFPVVINVNKSQSHPMIDILFQ